MDHPTHQPNPTEVFINVITWKKLLIATNLNFLYLSRNLSFKLLICKLFKYFTNDFLESNYLPCQSCSTSPAMNLKIAPEPPRQWHDPSNLAQYIYIYIYIYFFFKGKKISAHNAFYTIQKRDFRTMTCPR